MSVYLQFRGICATQDGQRRIYSADGHRLAEIDTWLAPYRRFWSDQLDALEEFLEGDE